MNGILLDSNLIIYAVDESTSHFRKARDFIDRNLEKLAVADQNVNESIRVLTHKKYKGALTTKKAIRAISKITDECIHIVPNLNTRGIFFELITKHSLTADEIYDAYLVSTMLSNGVYKLATVNAKDFKRYEDVELISLE